MKALMSVGALVGVVGLLLLVGMIVDVVPSNTVRLVEGYMPVQMLLEFALFVAGFTGLSYMASSMGMAIPRFWQGIGFWAFVLLYLKFRVYPPIPFSVRAMYGTVSLVAVFMWVSANEEACLQILNLAVLKNAGVLPLMLEANALGVMQMGCLPDRGPGFAEPSRKGKGYHEMKSGMKTLYIAGTVPDVDFKSDFLIIQASHRTALTEKADLVLPATVLYEKQGTIINTYGKQKSFAEAEKPAAEARDGVDIAALISLVMDEAKSLKAKDIAASVKKVKPGKSGAGLFKPVTAKAGQPYAVSATVLLMAMNQGMLSGSGVARVLVVNEPVLQQQ